MSSGILLLALAGGLASAQPLSTLYDEHDWFRLRDAVSRRNVSPLYRGAVAYAFHDLASAEKYLRLAVKSAPGSEQAGDAEAFLIDVAQCRGDYRRALSTVRALQAMKTGARGLGDAAMFFSALATFPTQRVSSPRAVNVSYNMRNGNLFIPASINGRSANYILDTGANFSVISESEAKRVGLVLREAPGLRTTDAAGNAVGMRVGLAHSLSVGAFELRNVAFLVARDKQQPFADLPDGWRGVLGFPVVLAFETLRLADGRFEAGFTPPSQQGEANMCFDGANPLVRGNYRGKALQVFLDTGAAKTRVMPAFAKEFPELMASASPGATVVRGVGGAAKVEAALLPELGFRIGGGEAVLKPAEVLLRTPEGKEEHFHVWAGMDLLSPPHKTTIDFRRMTFSLE